MNPLFDVDMDLYDMEGDLLYQSDNTNDGATSNPGRYNLNIIPPGEYLVKADPTAGTGYIAEFFDGSITKSEATPITVVAEVNNDFNHIYLDQGRWISGIIRDSGGTPLAGIDLDIYTIAGDRLDPTTLSASDGTFTLGPVPDGSYYVRADPDFEAGQHYVSHYYGGIPSRSQSTPITVSGANATGIDFNLPPGGVISGTVTGTGGAPLESMDMDIYDASGAQLGYDDKTKADGTYLLGPVPAGQYILKSDAPDGGSYVGIFYNQVLLKEDASLVTVTAGANTSGIDFNLFTGGLISGTIRDSGGSPISGIDIDIYDSMGSFIGVTALSGVDGSFSIGPLPDGDYFVEADPSQGHYFFDEFYGGVAELALATAITISGGNTSGIDIALETGGLISGTVRGTAGTPLADIDLDVYNATGERLSYDGTTKADGTYLIGPVPAGSYKVKSDPEELTGYVEMFYSGLYVKSLATNITVTDEATANGIDFDHSQGAFIAGTIVNTEGSPLENIDFDIFDETGNRLGATTFSESDGTYLLGPVPPGNYLVRADPDDNNGYMPAFYPDAFDFGDGLPITLTAAETVTGIDFTLTTAGWIEGRITDETGTPLANIDLDLFDAESRERLTRGGKSGPDGRYVIGPLPVGNILVRADPTIEQRLVREYYNEAIALHVANPVTITGGSGTTDIDFSLEPGSYIGGTVIDPGDGNPVAGVDIDVFRASDLFKMDQNAKTGADGSYSIGPLPAGSYLVQFDARSSTAYEDIYYDGSSEASSAVPIILTSDADITGINMDLPEFILYPEITVSDSNDPPGFSFSFQTQVGKEYTIEYSDDFAVDSWISLETMAGDGEIAAYEINVPPNVSRRFFRIRINSI